MDGFLGGYIFISTRLACSSADILEQALPYVWTQHIEEMKAYINTEARELDPKDQKRSFSLIRESGLGTLILNLYTTCVFLHAEKSQEDYAILTVRFEETPLINLEKEQYDGFVEKWTQLCQGAQANFGYFGRFPYVEDEEYRDSTFLAELKNHNIEQLGYEFCDCWLQYYGPQILHDNQDRLILAQSLEDVIQNYEYVNATLSDLDNEGVLFRSGANPWDLGDEDE